MGDRNEWLKNLRIVCMYYVEDEIVFYDINKIFETVSCNWTSCNKKVSQNNWESRKEYLAETSYYNNLNKTKINTL